ncbi:ThiF family adenylyltransferase [Methanosarcina sp. KYL-1]|uniref:HesA/MoeB/ThiF family protein n=1 Tax=Methanosarcina sp. KYL-1 TaxID=2602068 RepID=UPI0021015DA8|nr:ThiF family adenylyltransferase [Methanosarcina sp. KYL-1]MCQ1536126.1 ThiF family adenylyltransferase [Methanosarcina sp. KYL-1]
MLPKPTIYLPLKYIEQRNSYDLYGYYNKSTNSYNVITGIETDGLEYLGAIEKSTTVNTTHQINGVYAENGDLVFKTSINEDCNIEPYSLVNDIFSRNTGIIESSKFLKKNVLIAGCGSVGSLIAIELAKLGIGNFVLVDSDILAYHNICRHQCGIKDVGKYKVNAVEEAIHNINSSAKIATFKSRIQSLSEDDFKNISEKGIELIIGATDNRESDLYANRISQLLDIPFVSIGFWERAFAGEIFYSLPGLTACYNCVFGERNILSNRVSVNRHVYSFEEDEAKIAYEPGISLDINFITIIGLKIIVDLLNRNDSEYVPKVINSLKNFTLVCNNNDKRMGGELAMIFDHPLQITRSIVTKHRENCDHCKVRGKFYT